MASISRVGASSVFVLGQDDSDSSTKTVKDKNKSTPSKEKKRPPPSKTSTSINEDLKDLDQKWSQRLSRLEALIFSNTIQQLTDYPTLHQVKVLPVKQPPASEGSSDQPFMPLIGLTRLLSLRKQYLPCQLVGLLHFMIWIQILT